jgi:hypothetical protein
MSGSNYFQDLKWVGAIVLGPQLVVAVVSGPQISSRYCFQDLKLVAAAVSGPKISSRYCFQDLKLAAAIVSGPQGFFIENFDSNSPNFKENINFQIARFLW